MFLATRPNEENIRRFIAEQNGRPFSYREVGSSRNETVPEGYTKDHNRVLLGTGQAVFEQAIEAVRSWKMFDFSWVNLYFDTTPIEAGQTVAVLIKHYGFWSLNATCIVYVLDRTANDIETFGFAYGTLAEHGERGEERFSVEYRKQDESVWYDLFAFSQANHILAKLGYPAVRFLQQQFATESKAAMQRAIQS